MSQHFEHPELGTGRPSAFTDPRFLDLQTLRAALGGYISNGQIV
jgi:hypothetical protein